MLLNNICRCGFSTSTLNLLKRSMKTGIVALLDAEMNISENCLKLIMRLPSDSLLKIPFICFLISSCYFCYFDMLPNSDGRRFGYVFYYN